MDYLAYLLKRRAPAAASAADDLTEPKTRDADGKQLTQKRLSPSGDFSLEDLAQRDADLDLLSIERRRAMRSRPRRKR